MVKRCWQWSAPTESLNSCAARPVSSGSMSRVGTDIYIYICIYYLLEFAVGTDALAVRTKNKIFSTHLLLLLLLFFTALLQSERYQTKSRVPAVPRPRAFLASTTAASPSSPRHRRRCSKTHTNNIRGPHGQHTHTKYMCHGILFKEPNPYAGSRPRDIIGLYRKHKTLNPNPTARQPISPGAHATRYRGRISRGPMGGGEGRERKEAGGGAIEVEGARWRPMTVVGGFGLGWGAEGRRGGKRRVSWSKSAPPVTPKPLPLLRG